MAQVTFEINGRAHTVGCGDGEEPRLLALSKYIDTKVRELAGQVGGVGEARLFLLTCLTLADELGEAYDRAVAWWQQGEQLEGIGDGACPDGLGVAVGDEIDARIPPQQQVCEGIEPGGGFGFQSWCRGQGEPRCVGRAVFHVKHSAGRGAAQSARR
jgi:cell division protein ZapA (FtsZ GTPase activity inhibitor)